MRNNSRSSFNSAKSRLHSHRLTSTHLKGCLPLIFKQHVLAICLNSPKYMDNTMAVHLSRVQHNSHGYSITLLKNLLWETNIYLLSIPQHNFPLQLRLHNLNTRGLLLECLSTTIQRYSIRKYSFQKTFSRKSYKLLDSAFQTNLTSKIFHKSELPLQTKEIKSTCTKLLNRPAFRKMHWLLGATPQHL